MKEQDNGEEVNRRTIYYKDLTLITPASANSFGIPAEAPVFASPYHRGVINCSVPRCRVKFTPLVYAAHHIVRAQHFHPRFRMGGIYFYRGTAGEYGRKIHSGWIALVEPQGKVVSEPFGLIARQVRVEQIVPYCIAFDSTYVARVCDRRLTDGLAVESTFLESQYYLAPVCNEACLNSLQRLAGTEFSYEPRFRFRVAEDGRVVFGNI